MTIRSSGSERRYGRNLRSERRWWRQSVECGVGEQRVGDLVRRRGPFEREEQELRLECGGLLAEPRDERTVRAGSAMFVANTRCA